MKFSKPLSIIALSFALAACSGGPSDSDVQAIVNQSMEQVMSQMGVANLSDILDIKVKIMNKAKQDDGRWLVETQTTAVAKKDWQGGKKGDAMPPVTDQVYMQKGDNGWIASR